MLPSFGCEVREFCPLSLSTLIRRSRRARVLTTIRDVRILQHVLGDDQTHGCVPPSSPVLRVGGPSTRTARALVYILVLVPAQLDLYPEVTQSPQCRGSGRVLQQNSGRMTGKQRGKSPV